MPLQLVLRLRKLRKLPVAHLQALLPLLVLLPHPLQLAVAVLLTLANLLLPLQRLLVVARLMWRKQLAPQLVLQLQLLAVALLSRVLRLQLRRKLRVVCVPTSLKQLVLVLFT